MTNVVAVPEERQPFQRPSPAVDLAYTTTPIIDIDRTLGPLNIMRELLLTYGPDGQPDRVFTQLLSRNRTAWNGSIAHASTDLNWNYQTFSDKGAGTRNFQITPLQGVFAGGFGRDVGAGGVGAESKVTAAPVTIFNQLSLDSDGVGFLGAIGTGTDAEGQIGLGPVAVAGTTGASFGGTAAFCSGTAGPHVVKVRLQRAGFPRR